MCSTNESKPNIWESCGSTLNAIRQLDYPDIKSIASVNYVSWPTAKSAVDTLLKANMIEASNTPGAKQYTICDDYGIFTGISIDDTMVKVVFVNFGFKPIDIATDKRFIGLIDQLKKVPKINIEGSHISYNADKDYMEYLEINNICSDILDIILNDDSFITEVNLISVGISLPGIIDKKTSVVTFCPNIPSLVGMPIDRIIKANTQKKLKDNKIALVYSHDTVAALVYEKEHSYFAGKDNDSETLGENVAFLFHNFGIGISYIMDNRLIYGSSGAFGEVGHIHINFEDLSHLTKEEDDDFKKFLNEDSIEVKAFSCACGNKTCIENLVRVKVFNTNSVKDFIEKTKDVETFKNDHPYRYKVLVNLIGQVISIIVNVLNADTIIISNHVIGRMIGFREDIEAYMNSIALTFSSRHCKIVCGSTIPEATAIGATIISYYNLISKNKSETEISWIKKNSNSN